jgi:hypothetical protein
MPGAVLLLGIAVHMRRRVNDAAASAKD